MCGHVFGVCCMRSCIVVLYCCAGKPVVSFTNTDGLRIHCLKSHMGSTFIASNHRWAQHSSPQITDGLSIHRLKSHMGSAFITSNHRLAPHSSPQITDGLRIHCLKSQMGSAFITSNHRWAPHSSPQITDGSAFITSNHRWAPHSSPQITVHNGNILPATHVHAHTCTVSTRSVSGQQSCIKQYASSTHSPLVNMFV